MLEGTFRCFAFFVILIFNVPADLLGLESGGGYGIPARPEVFSGEVLFLAGESSGNGDRTFPFQESDDRRDCELRRDHDEHMDVVGHDVPFENRAFFLFCKFVEEWTDRFSDVSIQDFPSLFGYEHDVIFAIPF